MFQRRPHFLWITAVVWRSYFITTAEQAKAFAPAATPFAAPRIHSLDRRPALSTPFGATQRWMSNYSKIPKATSEEDDENKQIEETTRAWLERVVVGMNLCPFAERPAREGKLKIQVIRGNDEEAILTLVLAELITRQDVPGTTLLVCPECFPDDFEQYLQVVDMIENGLMVESELSEDVQVAPFHPLFRFEGSDPDEASNWTNRSPYPIFHVLREIEVTKAVDLLGGDAGLVWKRNVNLLHALEEELGAETMERVLQGQAGQNDVARSQTILRSFKLQLGSADDKEL